MVLNDVRRLGATLPCALMALLLAGCSVTGSRESPINEVTRGSPTVVDIYRGQTEGGTQGDGARREAAPQERLRSQSQARPIAAGDEVRVTLRLDDESTVEVVALARDFDGNQENYEPGHEDPSGSDDE